MDIWRCPRRAASFGRMSRALLLAEAEPGTRAFLERHLASEGFEVLGADAEREALELAERARPDLVLIGALEDAAGAEVCRRLREGVPGRSWDRNVPVIVLGATQADAVDRVQAFERGCDDFVPRPFHYEELVARIHAVLRRTQPPVRERLAAGPVAIDRATRRVTVHGFPVALAAKEFELLAKLATDPTRVFTKEELLREVWGFVALGRTRTLDSHASRLRRKLALAGAEDCVLNVWGVGYRLLGEDEALRRSA
jgi:DNA-binding response OmpR family regulator